MSEAKPEKGYPDVDYLSARLELADSGNGETRRLTVGPLFDHPRVEVAVLEHIDADAETFVVLNRRQIECLSGFLSWWLAHCGEAKG